MEIVDDRALLLQVRQPDRITNIIPRSKHLGNHKVLVKWGIDEARILTNLLSKPVPSPINVKYEWPRPARLTPFEHQKKTSEFLTLRSRAYVLSEQGTGKTTSCIWAADYLLEEKKINRVLVVCPLSIMDCAWRADLFSFAMHRTVSILHGSKEQRKKALAQGNEFCIINYDGVEVILDELKDAGFDLVILDEATFIKNTSTDRWKAINKLVTSETWLWMLTGTPAAQSPEDAYGLAKMMNPKSVPRAKSSFRDMVMLQVSRFKWVPKKEAPQIVHNILQPAIRYRKQDCLDLPEMVVMDREAPLSRMQKKVYEQLRKEMAVQAAGEEITSSNAAINMNKLLQISSGAVYSDDGDAIQLDIRVRYRVLREVIDEAEGKILVFVPFRHAIDVLHERLEEDGIPSARISGDVSAGERTEIFRKFQQTDSPRVLVIQPQAASHGVTLTAANTVVWWGPVPSVETYGQANARIHRPGQHRSCSVVHLQGSPVERHVYNLLSGRIDQHTKLVDLYSMVLDT